MKKFTVLVVLALLAAAGTSYATDRTMAPTMEPATATIVPQIDMRAAVAAGIHNTVNLDVNYIATDAQSMLTEEVAGKWGLVTVVSLAGVPKQLFLRPTTPCRLVDTRVDGGAYLNGETRKYLLPGGSRCGMSIPPSVNPEGAVALVEVRMEATEYPWSWGDNGPTFDFVGQAYSPDWFTMNQERAFLFAVNEGSFPETATGKVRGFVALKRFPGLFSSLWGLETQVKSQWEKADFRAHVTIDIVGWATPTFNQ